MTARIASDGAVLRIDSRRTPDESVTAKDVEDSETLAQILGRILREQAAMRQTFVPRRIDYEGVTLSSSASVRLEHGLGGRVTYSVVGLREHRHDAAAVLQADGSDDGSLVLDAYLPVVLVLGSTFTTTSATAQNTALTFPVRDGEQWLVEFWGFAGCSTLNGMKYAIGAPSGSTVDGILDSSLGASTTDARVAITAVNTLTSAVHTVAGGERDDHINARLTIVGSGSVTIQVASNTGGDTTTLRSLACLRATRMRTSVTTTATIRVEEAG